MSDRIYPMPKGLEARALAWLTGEGGPAAPARDASTVMLVRDATDGGPAAGVEVFMMKRVSTMAFAPSAYVFPGGGVDARDADEHLPWAGPSPAHWATVLSAPSDASARTLVVAAARELFEECGVLLAGPGERRVVEDVRGPGWQAARRRLLAREQSFAELLMERNLVLRTDLLAAHAHWITPCFEPRRYDTRFFVAQVPQGQVPDNDNTEADHARWVRPADLLAEMELGSAVLFPPTVAQMEALAGASDAASCVASPPSFRPILAEPIRRGDETALLVRATPEDHS